MKCPNCETGELIRDTRDMPYTYKGETVVIPHVTGQFCANQDCGEAVLDMAESMRTSKLMLKFNKQVNGSLVSPEFIAGVREKLNLTQQEAAAIFGGGINAFSRYETGKTRPPIALVRLLKLLDKHPELLNEVREAA